jgi:poly-gamma-glutamate capsule biosynthesis protein CapA/YwtB (metallophosphatase superfamily)
MTGMRNALKRLLKNEASPPEGDEPRHTAPPGGSSSVLGQSLKAVGAIVAVVALCAPLMFLPVEDTQPAALGYAGVTITVPPTVVVATTIPGLETTTTTITTESTVEPPPPEIVTTTTTTEASTDIVIAAVGEVIMPPEILASVLDPKTGLYDFGPVFAPIAPYLDRADYAVASLQPRLAGAEESYTSESDPNAPWALAFALKDAGIDLIGTANRHSLDLGWAGVTGTLDRLELAGLAHVGTARSSAERRTPRIVDIKGIRVAFLDYTDTVAGSLPAGEERPYAVNLLDPAVVKQDAMTARSWGADAVVVMLEYGATSEQDPTADQVTQADYLLDYGGVDVILGSQAHVVQTIGHRVTYATFATWRTNDKYVAYSLGDFLSLPSVAQASATSATTAADTGIIAYLHIQKRGLRTYVSGVSYVPLYVQKGIVQAGSTSPDRITGGATSTTSTSTSATAGADATKTVFRILPVLPGLDPDTDVVLTAEDKARMATIWEYAWNRLYRPDERISPLSPSDLGL